MVSLLIHSSKQEGLCIAEVPGFPSPCGFRTWSSFRVIRFLLSKDTDSQQARTQAKRAKTPISILPKDLRL